MTTPIRGAERVHGVDQAHACSVQHLDEIIEIYRKTPDEPCDLHVNTWDCTVDALSQGFSGSMLATLLVTAIERLTRA